jgi:hypothetical protein
MQTQETSSPSHLALKNTSPTLLRTISDVCFVAGFASIIGSIVAWGLKKNTDETPKAERFGIFIGLWAPTFFILSNRFERYADRAGKE